MERWNSDKRGERHSRNGTGGNTNIWAELRKGKADLDRLLEPRSDIER